MGTIEIHEPEVKKVKPPSRSSAVVLPKSDLLEAKFTPRPMFPVGLRFCDEKSEIPNTNIPPHKTVAEIVEGERKVAREGMVHGRPHHF